MRPQPRSRPVKNPKPSSTKKQNEPSWWDTIKILFTSGLWYFAQIIIFLAFIGLCITYVMGFSGSVEELRALDSIEDKEAIELLSTEYVDSALNGRIVFVQGAVKTQDMLKDLNFAISVHGLALHRQMFFYQWQQKKKSKGQNFYYDTGWSTHPVDTSSFEEHKNNTLIFPLKSSSTYAGKSTLGAYIVDPALLEVFPLRQNFSPTLTPKLSEEIKEKILQYAGTLDTLSYSMQAYFSGNLFQDGTPLVHKKANNELFLGLDVANPRVGDILIRYTYTPEQTVSFFATLQGNRLHLFVDEDGNASKETIWAGKVSMEEVYIKTKEYNMLYFFLNLFLGHLSICLMFFIELQLLLPHIQEKGYQFTKDTLYKNAMRSLKYGTYTVIPLSLLAWIL